MRWESIEKLATALTINVIENDGMSRCHITKQAKMAHDLYRAFTKELVGLDRKVYASTDENESTAE